MGSVLVPSLALGVAMVAVRSTGEPSPPHRERRRAVLLRVVGIALLAIALALSLVVAHISMHDRRSDISGSVLASDAAINIDCVSRGARTFAQRNSLGIELRPGDDAIGVHFRGTNDRLVWTTVFLADERGRFDYGIQLEEGARFGAEELRALIEEISVACGGEPGRTRVGCGEGSALCL